MNDEDETVKPEDWHVTKWPIERVTGWWAIIPLMVIAGILFMIFHETVLK